VGLVAGLVNIKTAEQKEKIATVFLVTFSVPFTTK
jgi:hypothetical protein